MKGSSTVLGGTTKISYLDTQGLSVFLNNTNFDRTFGDQKCAGIEMILHGERIATDGDIRLLPTPEQWDACPTSSSHGADAAGTLYNKGDFSDFGFLPSIYRHQTYSVDSGKTTGLIPAAASSSMVEMTVPDDEPADTEYLAKAMG